MIFRYSQCLSPCVVCCQYPETIFESQAEKTVWELLWKRKEEQLYAILCTSDVAQGHSLDLLPLLWSRNRLVVKRELAQRLGAVSEATHFHTQARTHKHAQ